MPAERPTLCTQSILYHPLKHLNVGGRNTHPGQAQRSRQKRELQAQRAEAETAEAGKLGITVDKLRQQKYDAIKHLFREAVKISAKADKLAEARIYGWQNEARCPSCGYVNEYCMTGRNTCRRCSQPFLGTG